MRARSDRSGANRIGKLAGPFAAFLGVVMAWAISEVLFRWILPVSTVAYSYDRSVGHFLRPNGVFRFVSVDYDVAVFTNSAGFHDRDHEIEKPDNIKRILVLGDSMVEALQVPYESGFTHLLEERVREWYPGVEVLNLAVSGNGPSQYLRMLEQKGLAYGPDVVVLAITTINDFRNSVPELELDPAKPYYSIDPRGSLLYVPPPEGIDRGFIKSLTKLLKRSASFRFAIEKAQRLMADAASPVHMDPSEREAEGSGSSSLSLFSDWNVFVETPPDLWSTAYALTLRTIEESERLARRSGARFLVMMIAPVALVEDRMSEALRGVAEPSQLKWDEQRPFRAVEALGKSEGFDVINLMGPFREDYDETGVSASWPHDGHWNARGHQLAASIVSKYLEEHSREMGFVNK